jgi:FkbM family methyltransferase
VEVIDTFTRNCRYRTGSSARVLNWLDNQAPTTVAGSIWRNLRWRVGGLVELFGNRVALYGCLFFVDDDYIPSATKGYMLLGLHENLERYAIRRFLDPGAPVLECGAAFGVVSCITNRRLDWPRRHVVVEPNPRLLGLLETNRDVNRCAFDIVPAAIAYGQSHLDLIITDDPLGSGVKGQQGARVRVPARSVGSLLEEYDFRDATLICDIEGAECDMVTFDADSLAARVKDLVLEVHEEIVGPAAITRMFNELCGAGFGLIWNDGPVHVWRRV